MAKCHFKWNLHVAATTKAHKELLNAWTVDCYASVRRKRLKERNGSKDCLTDGVVARTWASFVPKMVPSFIWTWEAQPSFIWLAHTHNTASISSAILSQKCLKKAKKMSRDDCTNHSKPPPLHGEAAQCPNSFRPLMISRFARLWLVVRSKSHLACDQQSPCFLSHASLQLFVRQQGDKYYD